MLQSGYLVVREKSGMKKIRKNLVKGICYEILTKLGQNRLWYWIDLNYSLPFQRLGYLKECRHRKHKGDIQILSILSQIYLVVQYL